MPIRNHSNCSGIDPHVRCLWELSPVGGTLCWSRGRTLLSEQQQEQHGMNWLWSSRSAFPVSRHCWRWGGRAQEGGRSGGKTFLKDILYFPLFCSLLIISLLLSPGAVCFVCDDIWWVISVLIATHEPSTIFSLPDAVAEESDRATFVGIWYPARVNTLLWQPSNTSTTSFGIHCLIVENSTTFFFFFFPFILLVGAT